jgi:AraC family transcriptional regulator
VALDHGFSSAATFARAFRAHFGMSATEWRRGGAERWRARRRRKMGKQLRKAGKAQARRRSDTPPTRIREGTMSVIVRELPVHHVAYMRYVGPYGARGIPELWMRLRQWMGARGLELASTVRLGVAYDDAGITEPAKCSYDACVVVPRDFTADRWVNLMDIPAGRYAMAAFHGTADDIESAWRRVFAGWLPDSSYQPDDRACFEIYRGAPHTGSKAGAFRCELCLPVRAL